MRVREPDLTGHVTVGGVRIGYESFGTGEPVLVLFPTWTIVHSGHWKAQVPYLSRHVRVVTFDGPGNGRSDRPVDPAAYGPAAVSRYLTAVLDELGIDRAFLAGVSCGAWWALFAAARLPDRVLGVAAIAPAVAGLAPALPERSRYSWSEPLDTDDGWARYNRHFWSARYPDFVEFFMSRLCSQPHSTRQYEDAVGWARQTTPDVLIAATTAEACATDCPDPAALLAGLTVPVLVIRGDADRIRSAAEMARVAELTGARDVVLAGADHLPQARRPVAVNRLLRDFVRPAVPARRPAGPKRVLYLSSPIGLGHAERDVAIAGALRDRHPGVQIEWLAQHPVTEVLRRRGERIHPASRFLVSEAAHVDAAAGEHDLHAFHAVRSMDEILLANFMLFADLVEREDFALWIGDEAWELDHFLLENPGLKRAPYAWLTDFVGWLPTAAGGAAEAALTADYNAEMVEQIDRTPGLRDRALFVGNPADLLDDPLGEGLPSIREWTTAHFTFTGYVTDAGPLDPTGRRRLRAELGWAPDEPVCVATVGGSGTGEALLRRVIAAFPAARRLIPGLRLVVVAGPRIDPAALPSAAGLEIHGYVDRMDRMLAACDVAVTHGGLTTTMTLTAYGRPFVYVPLRNHFEQNRHVRHRLEQYRSGICLEWTDATPDGLAAAVAAAISRPVAYRAVETDGADRAAALLAELI